MAEDILPGDGAGEGDKGGKGAGNGGGKGGEGDAEAALAAFRASLPEDLREDPSLKDIKDVPGLAKSFVNAQAMVGADKVAIPGSNATDAQWGEFWNKLGRPESAEKYEFVVPGEGSPLAPDPEVLKGYATVCHKLGISQTHAAGIMQWFNETSEGLLTAAEGETGKLNEQGIVALKKEFGAAYAERVDFSRVALKTYGDNEFVAFLKSNGGQNNPAVVRFMAKIGQAMSEDKLGSGGLRTLGKTPEAARAELEALSIDKEFQDALMHGDNPGHKAALERKKLLYEQAYPEQPAEGA